ncbi:penicillin-binding protein 2 [Marinobacteraceae bacterium S3BR75-40.1]
MGWGTFKDTARERAIFQRRTLISFLVVLVMAGLLALRFYFLQVVEHERFTTLSEKNRVQVQSVAPTRGLIYDRNGVLLAENRPVFSVTLVPERVDDIDGTIERLRKLIDIPDEDVERFYRRLHEYRRPYEPVPLRYQITEEEIASLSVNRYRLPGVEVDAELVRYYPYPELTAHALGYVGRINENELRKVDPVNYAGTHYIGKLGIERVYEDLLHGHVGFQNVETNARGRVLRVLEREDPAPGADIHLQMDIRLQRLAYEALAGRRGAIVALDPHTGGILALASAPSFDANLFVTGINTKDYAALRDSRDVPLFNRAIRGQYPPGSTVKPMMAIAGLDSGTVTPQTKIYDPGYYKLENNNRVYRDWKRWGHGWMTLHDAIAQSCDTYFYDMGYKMGIDTMSNYLAEFGFGRNAALDVGEAKSGLLPTRDWKRAVKNQPWYPGDSVNMSIGQGYLLATPLQLATATAVVAGRGEWHAPRHLKSVDGQVTAEEVLPESELHDIKLKDPSYWEEVVGGMEAVMDGPHGTARSAARGAPYKMAGKTGTAQVFSLAADEEYNADELAERLRDHALFVGFAPVEDPQIAVAVLVENGGGGSHTAAPLARKIFDAWILDLNKDEKADEIMAEAGAHK